MDKCKEILEKAHVLARSCQTWADLSNSLFDPLEGLVARTFLRSEERTKFRKTSAYEKLHALVEDKMKVTGIVGGAHPKKSGKFIVRLPRTLHAALEREAEAEGTSLNQLVVTKLAVQLDNLAGEKIEKIMEAFLEVREGYSADKVIADPTLNRRFLRRCRELGLAGTDFELNWELLNARKSSKLSNLSNLIKTTRYSVGKVIDEFEYASELAVRYMQRSKDVSLDQIICDPELAEEFDTYASRLAPNFSSLQYRWAAFSLRKAGRLGKRADEIGEVPELESFGKVKTLKLQKIPEVGGLYLFSSGDTPVFASQTDNLRHRLERHVTISSSGLPDWLWDVRRHPLQVEIAPLPDISRSLRQTIELVLAKERKPVLNFSRKVA
ncbi:MAG: toxin-antitoxin system HicB family antitoxin [Candidatus Babeliaceae bacterium]|nr:toxin-antitoxin system HicB family antitoxin [Candidatus Babeliaceae bacterium]